MDGKDKGGGVDDEPGRLVVGEDVFRVVSVTLPDLEQFEQLTAAERDICRHLLKGATDSQIAERRETSKNTVAKQLRTIYRKMGVPGRSKLIAMLCDEPSGF